MLLLLLLYADTMPPILLHRITSSISLDYFSYAYLRRCFISLSLMLYTPPLFTLSLLFSLRRYFDYMAFLRGCFSLLYALSDLCYTTLSFIFITLADDTASRCFAMMPPLSDTDSH